MGYFWPKVRHPYTTKEHPLHANLLLDLHKLTGPRYFQMPVLLKKHAKNSNVISAVKLSIIYRKINSNLATLKISLSRPWRPPFEESHENGPALVLREQVSPLQVGCHSVTFQAVPQ